MIIRIFEPSVGFGEITSAYEDFECSTYQVYSGVLHIMRYKGEDLYVPLSSMKMFKVLGTQEPQVGDQLEFNLQDKDLI